MTLRRRVISGFCLVSMAALAGYTVAARFRTQNRPSGQVARLGRELPPLVVVDPYGNRVDLSQALAGRRSVVVFYSASCHACQAVLPGLKPFPPELTLLLVNEEAKGPDDSGGPSIAQAVLFHDLEGVFARSFPMSPLPTILFIDERGTLRAASAGGQTRETLQTRLKEFAERP